MTDAIADALDRFVPDFEPVEGDWEAILEAASPARVRRARLPRRRWRPVLVTVAVVAALAAAGVAVAAGLGAFHGLSAAQHPRTSADVLGRRARVDVKKLNAWNARLQKRFNAYDVAHGKAPHKPLRILPDTTRLIGRLPLPGLGNAYAAADTLGSLCIVFEGGIATCTLPFSRSSPALTIEAPWWGAGVWSPVGYGVVMDGITAVSFTSRSRKVTVPVEHNLWYFVGPNSAGRSLTLHYADGTSELIHGECDGSCGKEGPTDLGNPAGLPPSDG